MKVSEITVQNIAEYLRLADGEYTETQISVLLEAAKAYIRSYTGLDDTAIDTHPEFIPVVYILSQDFYDNREMQTEKTGVNRVVETILGMHCINLLPTPEVGEVV